MRTAADTDTIAAIATPPGRGGLCIIRLSGPAALQVADQVAGPLPPARRAALRPLCTTDGQLLDRGLVLAFPAPHSFTGEDVVELQLHGSPVLASLVLDQLIALGVREAGPGEFTRRAFLNDRLDLAQAEAVADVIASASAEAARAALRSLEGEFSAQVTALADALIALRVRLEAGLDFPEEGLDHGHDPELGTELESLRSHLVILREAAARGRALRDGLTLVIAGVPNAGKSSLLNRLAGYEAAIVTELPGTTRDLVRENILIDGMPLHVIDTAGLRADADRIEAEGIRRARQAMLRADLVLLVEDASLPEGAAPTPALPSDTPVLRVLNKIDLLPGPAGTRFRHADDEAGSADGPIRLSALTGEGVEDLRTRLKCLAGYTGTAGGAYSARRRHLDALALTARHIDEAHAQLCVGAALELAAEELRLAHAALGEITGRFSSEDLLGRIFGEFCIGK